MNYWHQIDANVVIWNVLIGGPNQSHNITFKELPRFEGKDFKATKLIGGGQEVFRKLSKFF